MSLLCCLGNLAKALRYHQNELALSAAAGNLLDEGVAHRKVGECLCEMGQYEEAVEHQKSHLQLARRLSEGGGGGGGGGLILMGGFYIDDCWVCIDLDIELIHVILCSKRHSVTGSALV